MARTGARRQGGFSLVSAVFILVVLAAAGALMVRISGVQRTTTSFALLGPKAFLAAASGLEWNVHRVLNVPGSCPVGVTTTTVFSLTEAGLQGFDVSVDCQAEIHTQATQQTTVYHITAIAERGNFGDRDYVSRRMETTITDAS